MLHRVGALRDVIAEARFDARDTKDDDFASGLLTERREDVLAEYDLFQLRSLFTARQDMHGNRRTRN